MVSGGQVALYTGALAVAAVSAYVLITQLKSLFPIPTPAQAGDFAKKTGEGIGTAGQGLGTGLGNFGGTILSGAGTGVGSVLKGAGSGLGDIIKAF